MSAALLAHAVAASPDPEQAIHNLFGHASGCDDPDAQRECDCGWTVYFVIDHAELVICDRWCSGRDCAGSYAGPMSEHEVLELLDASCAGCPECSDPPIDPEEESASRLAYEAAVRKGW